VIKETVNEWLKIAQDRLMPMVCLLCGGRAGRCGLCEGCRGDLPCDRSLPVSSREDAGSGIWDVRGLSGVSLSGEVVSVFRYQSPVDQLIQRLKFRGDLACARTLGILMAERLVDGEARTPDAILPMPLHRQRLAARGYNQAAELARPIAQRFGVPLDVRSCRRIRATAEQARLAASNRAANVAGAFSCERLPGRHVAVIDDVITTGHTMAALIKVLHRAGVGRIDVWVCARAVKSGDLRPARLDQSTAMPRDNATL
jgi:ComF family protein